jgi:signal transduction histidine kinase
MLPAGRLQSLVKNTDGNIWIASGDKLVELNPGKETFSTYGSEHGIAPGQYGTNTNILSREGDLIFARYVGFHSFKSAEFLKQIKSSEPDIRITGFRLLDENIRTGVSGQGEAVLTEPIWKTDRIDLENGENTFSFSIACFDFYKPELTKLQFMLEGYDRGWRSDVRNGETPLYVNVSPGEYSFKLRGANELGVWNTESITMDIIVHPPWWQTWWAYSSYGLLLIGGVFGTHKIQRRRVIVKERERTRQKELQQAREIEKAYNQLKETQEQLIHSEKMASLGELTAGIAHEIQNPLNFVNNFSEVNSELIREMKEELVKGNLEEVQGLANDIDENEKKILFHGKRADSIVKGMLQHSRSSDGKKQPTDLNTLADEYLRLAYHGLRAKNKSFNATLETDFEPGLPEVEIVPQEIGRVLLNLLTNAFHAVTERKQNEPEGYRPTVRLETRKTENGVGISVRDNGGGIPAAIKDKIFQPFFTTKPTGEGTGLGLSMSYDIVTKGHGGALEVESLMGQGTTFKVILPIKKD